MAADELKNDENGQVVGGARNSATKLYMLCYAHLYIFNISYISFIHMWRKTPASIPGQPECQPPDQHYFLTRDRTPGKKSKNCD